MFEAWKKIFTNINCSLKPDDRDLFVISQWQKSRDPNKRYLLYRILMSTFFVVSLILSIVDTKNLDQPAMFRVKWLIYLTNWGFAFCTVQSLVGTYLLWTKFPPLEEGNKKNTTWYKIYWATNVVAFDAAFAITILYWAVVYQADTMDVDYLNVIVHAFNSIAMVIEFFVGAHPVRMGHVYLPILFGSSYSIFTVIYHFSHGTSREGYPYIYKVIDWNKPIQSLLICVGAVLFLVINHCISYVMYRIRKCIHIKLMTTERRNESPVPEVKTISNDFTIVIGKDHDGSNKPTPKRYTLQFPIDRSEFSLEKLCVDTLSIGSKKSEILVKNMEHAGDDVIEGANQEDADDIVLEVTIPEKRM